MSSAHTPPDYHCCSCCRGRTPTRRTDRANQSDSPARATASSTVTITQRNPSIVFVVTDTCYPVESDFNAGRGTTRVDSVHTTMEAANYKAKNIIYDNDRGCTVDIDKIIEDSREGLYTGIGIGGKEEKEGCCYARKCEVERIGVDYDSDND